jgi:hypothetical protein
VTLEEYVARINETLVDASQILTLIAEKVKPLGILDEELVARLNEMEDRLLALIVDIWRDEAS